MATLGVSAASLVVVTTDDGASWSRRLAVLAAIAPITGALAVLVVARRAAMRGELRALAAIGADPLQALVGAVIGGAAMGLVGALIAASGWADLEALFPRPDAARIWVADGPLAMRELSSGLTLAAGGVLTRGDAISRARTISGGAHTAAVLCVALTAIAAPAWTAAHEADAGRSWRRGLVAVFAILTGLVAFQAVAAGSAPAMLLLIAPLVLAADACALAVARRA